MASAIQNQFDSLRQRLHQSQLGGFWRWWTAELAAMLPASWQERVRHAQRVLLLQLNDKSLSLTLQEGAKGERVESFDLDQDLSLQRQQIADLLAERELDEVPRCLLLGESMVLHKQLQMPQAAEANLHQALAFEMDRHTPFQADQVYFDQQVLERDKERGQLHLELVVAPREPVDDLITTLVDRGLAPTAMDVVAENLPLGLNMLPAEQRHRIPNRKARLNLLLAAVALVVLAGVMAQSLWLRESQIAAVEAAIDEVRIEARRVQNIRAQIEDASEAAGFMFKRRAENRPTVMVLAEVTRIMPDDTYLDRLRIWEGNVQMQGKSDNAQRLIEQVNDSPMMEKAGFRGSTRLDTGTQKEVFDINAAIVTP
ncbi:MAG: pilus assembly protein PilM [Xanthomonadales bacterium]|nr:pilus assembly protein PilM [Xanthomonadales bacterium]